MTFFVLIFDMDETLLTETPEAPGSVIVRPHAELLLRSYAQRCDVGLVLCSQGNEAHVRESLRATGLDKYFRFSMGREACAKMHGAHGVYKHGRRIAERLFPRVGAPVVIGIDDKPVENMEGGGYDHVIKARPFDGSAEDRYVVDELFPTLLDYTKP